MTVSDVVDRIRRVLVEPQTTGYYSPVFMVEAVNRAIKGIIPDIFTVSKFVWLGDLTVLETLLTLTSDTNYNYYNLSGLANDPFHPSIRARVDTERAMFMDIDKVWEYEGDDLAWFRPQALSAIVGNQLRFYGITSYAWNKLGYDTQTENFVVGDTITGGTSGATGVIVADADNGVDGTLTLKDVSGTFEDGETITGATQGSAAVDGTQTNCSLDVEYIKIPDYALANTVELSDYIIDNFLVYRGGIEAIMREPSPSQSKLKELQDKYTANLIMLRESVESKMNPPNLPLIEMQKEGG